MAQRLEIGVVRVTRGVLAERLARELADDRDGLVLRRARYEQVFMADDGRIRRAEQTPPLTCLPARQLRGDDAVVGLIVNVVHPDELAVGVQIRLAEGVQVAGNVLGIGVAVADAVKVVRLDLGHERKLRVDLLLRERLDGDDKVARDGDAGLLILDRHGDGDVLGILAGQRTVDLHARGVVHAGGHDGVGIAARDDDRCILAVHAEVACSREVDIIGGDVLAVALL